MKLQNLSMSRWADEPISGSIKFSDPAGNEIKLTLAEERCNEILKIVADQLVAATREQYEALTANVIEHTGQVLLK